MSNNTASRLLLRGEQIASIVRSELPDGYTIEKSAFDLEWTVFFNGVKVGGFCFHLNVWYRLDVNPDTLMSHRNQVAIVRPILQNAIAQTNPARSAA